MVNAKKMNLDLFLQDTIRSLFNVYACLLSHCNLSTARGIGQGHQETKDTGKTWYGGRNENALVYLNIWSPDAGTVWEVL